MPTGGIGTVCIGVQPAIWNRRGWACGAATPLLHNTRYQYVTGRSGHIRLREAFQRQRDLRGDSLRYINTNRSSFSRGTGLCTTVNPQQSAICEARKTFNRASSPRPVALDITLSYN